MMNQITELSLVTRRYLETFDQIFSALVQGMTSAPLTDSISHNFISQMIPHHRAAIEMSKNLLQYTTDIPLQNIALGIVSEQTKSIEDMQKALPACALLKNSQADVRRYQQETSRIMYTMFTGMASAPRTNCLNSDFMEEMIPHHRGAIAMSKNALRYRICPGLVPILNAIITSQERGVAQMERLLRKRSGC